LGKRFKFQNLEKIPDLTLVSIVKRKRDFEIIKKEKWYRIPVKNAPKEIAQIKYLAFYFPKIFGKRKWQILYYGKVKNIEVRKRIDLLPKEKDNPNALEDYYKITIKNLIRLKNPVVSKKGRRIIFIITTLEKLLNSKEINDLFITSPIEEKLYSELKKNNIPCERQYFVKEGNDFYSLDFAIFGKKGKIAIECDGEKYHLTKKAVFYDRERDNRLTSSGWWVLRFYSKDIKKSPERCVKLIKKTIKRIS